MYVWIKKNKVLFVIFLLSNSSFKILEILVLNFYLILRLKLKLKKFEIFMRYTIFKDKNDKQENILKSWMWCVILRTKI